jgi:hypothetical protein
LNVTNKVVTKRHRMAMIKEMSAMRSHIAFWLLIARNEEITDVISKKMEAAVNSSILVR